MTLPREGCSDEGLYSPGLTSMLEDTANIRATCPSLDRSTSVRVSTPESPPGGAGSSNVYEKSIPYFATLDLTPPKIWLVSSRAKSARTIGVPTGFAVSRNDLGAQRVRPPRTCAPPK